MHTCPDQATDIAQPTVHCIFSALQELAHLDCGCEVAWMTVILPFLDQHLTPCGDFMPYDEHAAELLYFDLAYG
ncbi:hypothetical protein CY34DRAFT_801310 [Suillus luteus UH-Slu-Lm8-n1]|uniref:Uncharacterized protein n=1 Tax=Suillus luteus UH-Slu-Lm8-n1 TaxID=930992 RepID=A0A0D0BRL3_9AGAM|nr:hypothetical protein CY34DRAFT_801310 [Suillus luteus UH-Slu-Lm8-n1]